MLDIQAAQKPIALYGYSDLNMWKMKIFVNNLAEN